MTIYYWVILYQKIVLLWLCEKNFRKIIKFFILIWNDYTSEKLSVGLICELRSNSGKILKNTNPPLFLTPRKEVPRSSIRRASQWKPGPICVVHTVFPLYLLTIIYTVIKIGHIHNTPFRKGWVRDLFIYTGKRHHLI